MGTGSHHAAARHTASHRVIVPAVLGLAMLATAVGLIIWLQSPDRTIGRLEHEEVSTFSRIRVRRDRDVRALTFVRDNGDELVQSRINLTEPHLLLSPYAHSMFATYMYQPHPRRVLMVGLGGGAMVRFLTHHEPHVQIDAVEIDPVVVRIADKFFGVRSDGNVSVHTADGVAFVESTSERYDLILMDAFLRPSAATDATGVPTRLKTVAFLGRLKEALIPGGIVAFNLNEHDRVEDDIATVASVFGDTAVFSSPPADNTVLIAAERSLPPDHELRARIDSLNARFEGALSFGDLLKNRE
jgi:spermidine synthase